MKKPENVIKHRVSKQDTIQGIALRYGVTVSLPLPYRVLLGGVPSHGLYTGFDTAIDGVVEWCVLRHGSMQYYGREYR